jgi:hypothetical protein
LVGALHFIGGTPQFIVPDNPRAAQVHEAQ